MEISQPADSNNISTTTASTVEDTLLAAVDQYTDRCTSVTLTDLSSNVALHRRRLANDPEMMHELHRYRRLMLLTILPSIGPDSVIENSTNLVDSDTNHFNKSNKLSKKAKVVRSQTGSTVSFAQDIERNFLPDSIAPKDSDQESLTDQSDENSMFNLQYLSSGGSSNEQLSRSVGCVGSGSAANSSARKHIKSANSETRLPVPTKGGVPLIDQVSTGKGDSKRSNRRRKNVAPLGVGDTNNGHLESDTSELDLLTLAELYLESRHRVFGEEWNQRPTMQSK